MPHYNTFIISRTDAIGDVVLTLPVAGLLRRLYPESKIVFLGKPYTRDVIKACEHVDEFIDWEKIKYLPAQDQVSEFKNIGADVIIHVFPDIQIALLAKKAGIKKRIGTTNRFFHWFTCNKLIRLSRRRSSYHEAQLNLKLLTLLGAKKNYSFEEITGLYGFTKTETLNEELASLLRKDKFNIIIHPKSKGSSREWGTDNFSALIDLLPKEKFEIFVTGTPGDIEPLKEIFSRHPQINNLIGKISLAQFIAFIAKADGLIACSTGPLHIAAATGINAIGIYPPIHPLHPGRWAPIGKNVNVFVLNKECNDCRNSYNCSCIRSINAAEVAAYIRSLA
ncbi:MAG: glycosyltransferase family 9 protein [Bacteroidetes bacterium]|nr:glycosyltransferase family 9 protein [Bacteroidota bacterium]